MLFVFSRIFPQLCSEPPSFKKPVPGTFLDWERPNSCNKVLTNKGVFTFTSLYVIDFMIFLKENHTFFEGIPVRHSNETFGIIFHPKLQKGIENKMCVPK